jgi:hypothetical protein
MVHTSLANFIKFEHTNHVIQASKHHLTHDWKIETTYTPKSTKWINTGSWGFNHSQNMRTPKFIGMLYEENNQGLNRKVQFFV